MQRITRNGLHEKIGPAQAHALECTKHLANGTALSKRVDSTGHHIMWCPGVHSKLYNTLHKEIKHAVWEWLHKNKPEDLHIPIEEPILGNIGFERKPNAPVLSPEQQVQIPRGFRADTGVFNSTSPSTNPLLLIDYTCTSPLNSKVPVAQYNVQGAAAHMAKEGKNKMYDSIWHNSGKVVAFVVELGGYIGAEGWRKVTNLVKGKYTSRDEDGRNIIDPEFQRQKRYLREKIQFLVQQRLAVFTAALANRARTMQPAAGVGNVEQMLSQDHLDYWA